MYIPGKTGFCFYDNCAQILEYIMARWSHSFVFFKLPHCHHYADVFEGIELPTTFQIHSVQCVSKMKSLNYLSCDIWGCLYSACPFLLWEYIYIYFILLSSSKSEIWPICHCLRLGHETMVCAACFYIFLCNICLVLMLTILTKKKRDTIEVSVIYESGINSFAPWNSVITPSI